MRKFVTFLLIILIFPRPLLAHEGELHFEVAPGVLPGEKKYLLEKIGEWFEVNLLTLSTKKKQEKKLALADERLSELLALFSKNKPQEKALLLALRDYQKFLRESRDLAEKIIFLDGAQLALAEKFEKVSRLHEEVLGELLERSRGRFSGIVEEALATARIENEEIFKFMVKNYQFNEADIQKYQKILDEHIKIVQRRLEFEKSSGIENSKFEKASFFIKEAKKFQSAGLNTEAYDLLKRAKNILY